MVGIPWYLGDGNNMGWNSICSGWSVGSCDTYGEYRAVFRYGAAKTNKFYSWIWLEAPDTIQKR